MSTDGLAEGRAHRQVSMVPSMPLGRKNGYRGCLSVSLWHGRPMKAQFYQFNLGGRRLGWSAKILLGLIALVGISLLVSFGLLAAVCAAVVFAATKLVMGLRRSFGLTEDASSHPFDSSVMAQPARFHEESGMVREIEVEVLPAESGTTK